ncbi:MAG: SDR family NAD(P)-dependent oxidoreductase [Bacteroidota bacterium]|nr:SDR family NAD(P)-dependent oxidoreductase [Bacteroidota bacterium]
MKGSLDQKRFGPWALITGASSGIGREFARQLASSGLNVVLVARRKDMLLELGRQLAKEFGVEYRVVISDLSEEGAIDKLTQATCELDIGLIVSNAGTGQPGKFLEIGMDKLTELLRLNTLAHLGIAHHFGQKLLQRRQGGLVLVGAMGADKGIPYMANDAGAKAYIKSLGESLHAEFKPMGVNVVVLLTPTTETPVLEKFGLTRDILPMKPIKVEQCVYETLEALKANRSTIIPGVANRIINAIMPSHLLRLMMAKIFSKALYRTPSGG